MTQAAEQSPARRSQANSDGSRGKNPSPRPSMEEATGSRRVRIGWIVVGSLAAGFATAAVLPFAPFVAIEPNVITGMVLLGFAVGWALLAGLSTWLSDQPQRWAVAPAVFMGLSGLVMSLGPNALVDGVLGWVWPPALLLLVLWMFRHARRDLHSRTRVFALYPVLVVLVLFSLGGAYQTVGAAVDSPALATQGRLIDVGGHRLHLSCTGSRGPTVVLEPGGGGMSADMGLIAPAVASDTRVCVYDRPGRGQSDPVAAPQDGAQIATDLHTLLQRGHIPGPYVLAGHSFGGLYVMSFAKQYPQDVTGMVLIDSTAPNTRPVAPHRTSSDRLIARFSAIMASSSRLAVGRLIGRFSYSTLPAQIRDQARASAATASYLASIVDEYGVASRSTSQAGELKDLHGQPLIVVTAGRGNSNGWMAAQNKMATLSDNTLHRVVAGATHESLLADPADATAVTQAINDVVASARTNTPLRDR
jgi:pimeloyl-ACP methyl ester carboxylesterase